MSDQLAYQQCVSLQENVEDLKDLSGIVKCHYCESTFNVNDLEENENYRLECPECGNDDFYDYTVSDYIFDDNFGIDVTLDIRQIGSISPEIKGCRIMVMFGGPNGYIDTNRRCVEVFWGGHVELPISAEVCQLIDDAVEEYICSCM